MPKPGVVIKKQLKSTCIQRRKRQGLGSTRVDVDQKNESREQLQLEVGVVDVTRAIICRRAYQEYSVMRPQHTTHLLRD